MRPRIMLILYLLLGSAFSGIFADLSEYPVFSLQQEEIRKAMLDYSLNGTYSNEKALWSFTFLPDKTVRIDTGISGHIYPYFIYEDYLVIRNDTSFFEFRLSGQDTLIGISLYVDQEIYQHQPASFTALPAWTESEELSLLQITLCYQANKYLMDSKDYRALEILEQGVSLGSGDCAYFLGMYYFQYGFSVKKNHERALSYFKKAGELGLPVAWFRLGEISEKAGDLTQAKVYYKKACDGGYEGGCISLMFLEDDQQE